MPKFTESTLSSQEIKENMIEVCVDMWTQLTMLE